MAHQHMIHLDGMTCRSCEILVQRGLKKIAGVAGTKANSRTGEVTLTLEQNAGMPTDDDIREALAGTPYRLHDELGDPEMVPRGRRWLEFGGAIIVLLALVQVLRAFGVHGLSAGVGEVASLGAVFVVGLIASASTCLALVGGLLLSVSAKWCESHQAQDSWTRFQPLLLFNVGRLAGYFLLGGVVGVIGSALTPSPQLTALLTIALSVVMLLLGLNILHLVPKRYCSLPLPRALTQRIHSLSDSHHPAAPMALGALTFFLPCGFTQSMQLLALSTGSFVQGGAIMLAFALGTLPSLLGISALGSLLHGKAARFFLTFSGAAVILLALFNVKSSLALAGIDVTAFVRERAVPTASADPNVYMTDDGRQVIKMRVGASGYTPDSFTIDPGHTTWVYAIGEPGLSGCTSVLTAPDYRLSVPLKVGGNWLGPIRSPQKSFLLTCSMGMVNAWVNVRS